MKRWQAAALGALLVVGLSGCAAPEVDTDAVQEWLDGQQSSQVPGALGSMSGMASPDTDDMGAHGITLTFEEPAGVTEVVFSCFGSEKMNVDVTMTSRDGEAELSHGTRTEDLVCADSPHTIAQTPDELTKIMVDGLSEDAQGAWSAVVVGEG